MDLRLSSTNMPCMCRDWWNFIPYYSIFQKCSTDLRAIQKSQLPPSVLSVTSGKAQCQGHFPYKLHKHSLLLKEQQQHYCSLGARSTELKRTKHWNLPSTPLYLAVLLGSDSHIGQFTLFCLQLQERPEQTISVFQTNYQFVKMATINILCRLLGNIVIKIHVENTCSAIDYLAQPPKLLWGT